MKRILIVITTAFVPYGGLTTVMMNYYRAMDKTGLSIDFASTNQPPNALLEELYENGSQYFNLGDRKKHLLQYLKRLDGVLKENHYDVIHVNGNSATMAFELQTAKRSKVPVRIAHGHTGKSEYSWLHKILFCVFTKSYTQGIAVSHKTGEWLFPRQEYILLNNAIPVEKYKYDAAIREKYRNNLGLSDKFVVGNVGKLTKQKNQNFLINVFYELKKRKKRAHLLLVGGGDTQKELERQCKNLGIQGDVTFLGMREDASGLLQAMDIFVFPSIIEGLGMALVEAQAAGLYCFASENVPRETCVSSFVQYLSLDSPLEKWSEAVLGVADCDRKERSQEACGSIREHGYDICEEASKLKAIYSSDSEGKRTSA